MLILYRNQKQLHLMIELISVFNAYNGDDVIPIVVTLVGIETDVSAVHQLKASLPNDRVNINSLIVGW